MAGNNPDITLHQNVGLLGKELLDFDMVAAESLLIKLNREIPSLELVEKVIVPALIEIGDGWEKGTVALSQVYLSGLLIERFVNSNFQALITVILPPKTIVKAKQMTGIITKKLRNAGVLHFRKKLIGFSRS